METLSLSVDANNILSDKINSLAYDHLDEELYWIVKSPNGTTWIQRKRLTSPAQTQIVAQSRDLNDFVDLVLNPYSRILYWTSSRSNSINATRLIGEPTSIGAISSPGDFPRLLAYHFYSK